MVSAARQFSLELGSTASALAHITRLNDELYEHYSAKLRVEPALTRQLVSFQANKSRAANRWYKYKEAFSAALVEYLLQTYGVSNGPVLDPFAGSGTTLFAASALGLAADGIELLPIGQEIIRARLTLYREFTSADFATLQRWHDDRPWQRSMERVQLPILRITTGAYPDETAEHIERFMALVQHENENVRTVLMFALLCVLEAVSYTRKDGQYLRWDYRSGRQVGAIRFDKGRILPFDQALCDKLQEILIDAHPESARLRIFSSNEASSTIHVFQGSCLDVLSTLPDGNYSGIITSPPYCNRYDYTRTYALELALLGVSEKGLIQLRQEMLSCTVESRAKDLLALNPKWLEPMAVADNLLLLQTILQYLDGERAQGKLNNNGIPRMVRGYFYEMACVIAECSRVMKSGARLFMVNDNVRYAGASISVDLILSAMAEQMGFVVENVLILPQGKGNSSQQMGEHGRDELRKCVYVWQKA
jgi:DNA modification methylase